MNIIEVIPIKKGNTLGTLTYFTSQDIYIGSIVSVPVRNKKIKGIVVDVKKAQEIKSEIKKAGFTLKKIEKIKAKNFFTQSFTQALAHTSDYFVGSMGSTINTLVPDYIFENVDKLKLNEGRIISKEKNVEDSLQNSLIPNNQKIYLIHSPENERYTQFRNIIRHEFAKKKTLYFIYPNSEQAINGFNILKKGIEKYTLLLHGNLNKKEIINTWNEAVNQDHPIVIVCTYAFLSIERPDIGSFIIENENSRNYKIQKRPYIDIKYFIEQYARQLNIDLYYSGENIRTETIYRKKIGEIIQVNTFENNDDNHVDISLIDMKKKKDETDKTFKVLSDETISNINKTIVNKRNMIILTLRRGVSPITLCEDCNNVVHCNNCNSPVVLHKNFFMCHRCGERRSTEEYCKTCGSWKLKAFGIGIDLVYETIKNDYKELNVYKIDSDSVKNDKEIKNIIEKWINEPRSILIGTEMMLQYIHTKAEYSSALGIDSLFSLPDFRIEEKIIHMLNTLKQKTEVSMVIETRKIDERVFDYFINKKRDEFYLNTIEERSLLGYPPFKTLIKITISGKRDLITKNMESIKDNLSPLEIDIFPAFTRNKKGEEVLHGIIKIEQNQWPDMKILYKLRELPPFVSINIDPENLL